MGGDPLTWTDSAPYLGVLLNKNLSWSEHIRSATSKARRTLGALRRNLKQCPRPLKERAYLAMVRPTLEYASCIWDPHLKQDIQLLESVQRRAARFVLNKPHRRSASKHDSVTEMISQLGWPSLQQRRARATTTMLYRIRTGLVCVPDAYQPCPAVTRQRRCHTQQLHVPQASICASQHSFVPRAARQWNALPEEAVSAPSIEAFKAAIQDWELQF